VALDHALVVEAHERDHVFDVVVGLDPPSSEAGAAGEHGVVVDASLLKQLSPDPFGKPKCAAWSPCRWPISREPTLNANSPRLPGPATTPGQEVTSSVIRLLARCSLIAPPRRSCDTALISLRNELRATMNPGRAELCALRPQATGFCGNLDSRLLSCEGDYPLSVSIERFLQRRSECAPVRRNSSQAYASCRCSLRPVIRSSLSRRSSAHGRSGRRILPSPQGSSAVRLTSRLEGERFLLQRSRTDHPEFPDSLVVSGVDKDELSMHYFDSRGVHRVYGVSVVEGVWRMWRHAPVFRNGSPERSRSRFSGRHSRRFSQPLLSRLRASGADRGS
jgi:hypothetical protein